MLVVLVGLPGSGKTTVGRHLARRLGARFQDSDHVIEQRIGCSIRDFFAGQGEEAFRDVEQSVIADLVQSQEGVLATGGGAVLRQANRASLQRGGRVFYLRSTPDEVFQRVRHDRGRPLLQVEDPVERLRSLFVQRDALYREAAHFVIEAARPTVPLLVKMIMGHLEGDGGVPPR